MNDDLDRIDWDAFDVPREPDPGDLPAGMPFPSVDEWLDLAPPTDIDFGGFTARVLALLHDERQLDRDLADADAALPGAALQHFAAPAPSPGFADRVLAATRDDRRQRWQALLARYVAPEPSPVFVSRTLAALAEVPRPSSGGAGMVGAGRLQDARGPRARWQQWRQPVVAVAALAAVALVWLVLHRDGAPPLELRLAHTARPISARAEATSPLAAVLAQVEHQADPFALFDEPADGSWLLRQASPRGALR